MGKRVQEKLSTIVKEVKKETGKNKISILLDIMNCKNKYQANNLDYLAFQMYKLNNKERDTILTNGINEILIKKYNNEEYTTYFDNREQFLPKFHRYLLRDYLIISDNEESYQEFNAFCKTHPSIIAKSPNNLSKPLIYKPNNKTIKKIYNELLEKKLTIIEETTKQCNELSKLHPYSINTIKFITLNNNIIAAYLVIGNNKKELNNLEESGMFAPINLDTGIIDYLAIDNKGETYDKHLLTNESILWFTIPKWPRLKRFVTSLTNEVKEVKYVEWNISLDNDPYLISASSKPNHYLYQLPIHRQDNTGILPLFQKYMNKKGE